MLAIVTSILKECRAPDGIISSAKTQRTDRCIELERETNFLSGKDYYNDRSLLLCINRTNFVKYFITIIPARIKILHFALYKCNFGSVNESHCPEL